MKRELKGFIVGIVVTCLFMSSVNAASIKQAIEVAFNQINVQVNGVQVDEDNFLYNKTTYVPLRTLSDKMGFEIIWDEETKTANVCNSQYLRKINQDGLVEYKDLTMFYRNSEGKLYQHSILIPSIDIVMHDERMYVNAVIAYQLYQIQKKRILFTNSHMNPEISGYVKEDGDKNFTFRDSSYQYTGLTQYTVEHYLLNEKGEQILKFNNTHEIKDSFNYNGQFMVDLSRLFELMGSELKLEIEEINTEDKYFIIKDK